MLIDFFKFGIDNSETWSEQIQSLILQSVDNSLEFHLSLPHSFELF